MSCSGMSTSALQPDRLGAGRLLLRDGLVMDGHAEDEAARPNEGQKAEPRRDYPIIRARFCGRSHPDELAGWHRMLGGLSMPYWRHIKGTPIDRGPPRSVCNPSFP